VNSKAAAQVRESPRYNLPEAAALLDIPNSTIDSWVRGRSYVASGQKKFWEPLIFRPLPDDPRLSFSNLVEAHVLRSLRTGHSVDMVKIRIALDYAEEKAEIKRLLLSDRLMTAAGEIFIEHLGQLLNIGRGGQVAMRDVLGAYLQRIDRDNIGNPARLFPFTRPSDLKKPSPDAPRTVVIDPSIAFGRPVAMKKAIRTATIAERFNLGESVSSLAEDYEMTVPEVEEALRYERRPRAEAA
jgi:uncharacterized protein (DUF433 family)